jgi:hypothetical protein
MDSIIVFIFTLLITNKQFIMKNILKFTMIALFASFVIVGCKNTADTAAKAAEETSEAMKDDAQNIADDAAKAAEEASATFEKERKEMVDETNEQLSALDKKIESSKADIKKAGKKADKKLTDGLAELEKEKETMGARLKEIENSTAEGWNDFKSKMSNLGDNIQDAGKELKEGVKDAAKELKK